MAQQIKLMADYESWPLWWAGEHDPGNIDPSTLPLSPATIARLEAWADTFDATLDRADPMASGFASDAAFEAFEAEGRALWAQLRDELAPKYSVLYHSIKAQHVLDDPGMS